MGIRIKSGDELDKILGRAKVEGSPSAGRGPKRGGKARAKWMQPEPGVMNKTEEAFAREVLDPMVARGEILRYDYECETLVLTIKGHRVRYTPDFRVILADLTTAYYEVKGGGGWQEDARVKIKAAADEHPYDFVGWTMLSKKAAAAAGSASRWHREEFPGSGGWYVLGSARTGVTSIGSSGSPRGGSGSSTDPNPNATPG